MIDVPGASLYHEIRGSGPVLLLIPGGAGDAGLYAGMTRHLTDQYTVVSYDPRALSRSKLGGPLTDQEVSVWSDDARRILDAVSPDEPAHVMGCSSGAIVALDLLAKHPGRVRQVIAHEPPLLELLPEPAPYRELFAEVRDTSRASGVGAAMARFNEALGSGEQQETELPPEIQDMMPRMVANMPVFVERMLVPFSHSHPDVVALQAVADKLIPAVGRASREQVPFYGPIARLAELTGRDLVEFPGRHLGVTEHPSECAALVDQLLKPSRHEVHVGVQPS